MCNFKGFNMNHIGDFMMVPENLKKFNYMQEFPVLYKKNDSWYEFVGSIDIFLRNEHITVSCPTCGNYLGEIGMDDDRNPYEEWIYDDIKYGGDYRCSCQDIEVHVPGEMEAEEEETEDSNNTESFNTLADVLSGIQL